MKIRSKPLGFWGLTKRTYRSWIRDKATRMAAALAYYSVFSLAPVLVLAIALSGFVFGRKTAEGAVVTEFTALVGRDGALLVQGMVDATSRPASGIIATILGVVVLLFGASGVFGEMQDSLNSIWGVRPRPGEGLKRILHTRLASFALILAAGFLLLVSLLFDTAIAALGSYGFAWLSDHEALFEIANIVFSLAMTVTLFAMIFKFLPDVHVPWKSVWMGAAVTAALFTAGKFLLGYYLGKSHVTSTYGVIGSIMIVLMWVYYSAQIFLFGAEFTKVVTHEKGTRVSARRNSVRSMA